MDSNKAQLKSQLIFSLDGVSNQMYRAARNEIYYGRFVPVAELVDGIDKVDREQPCAARTPGSIPTRGAVRGARAGRGRRGAR
ncbi:MAG: hypothetical protein IPP62_04055 [bacterium]|nr:hypothetical protein [bacterium]